MSVFIAEYVVVESQEIGINVRRAVGRYRHLGGHEREAKSGATAWPRFIITVRGGRSGSDRTIRAIAVIGVRGGSDSCCIVRIIAVIAVRGGSSGSDRIVRVIAVTAVSRGSSGSSCESDKVSSSSGSETGVVTLLGV